MTAHARAVEQRREARWPTAGEVWLVSEGPGSMEFKGQLVNCSQSGFRVTHSHPDLLTGQRFRFRHSHGKGRVVVIWNRIMAPDVDSGFLIVKE